MEDQPIPHDRPGWILGILLLPQKLFRNMGWWRTFAGTEYVQGSFEMTSDEHTHLTNGLQTLMVQAIWCNRCEQVPYSATSGNITGIFPAHCSTLKDVRTAILSVSQGSSITRSSQRLIPSGRYPIDVVCSLRLVRFCTDWDWLNNAMIRFS